MSNEDLLAKMIAQSGMKLLDATGATSTYPSWGLIVREDTVISTWADENGLDLIEAFNISGKTLVSTDPVLTIPNNKRTATLILGTGSVWQLR